jgi:hypothetical protein
MFSSRQTGDSSPRPKILPTYISWYINDHGQPWTSLDANPRLRLVHGQIAGSYGVLLATTDQMASSHVPSADQYPRRGDGRKGAYRRRMRWHAMAPAPPLPPSPRRAQRPGRGNGARAGSDSANEGQEVRALHVPYRRDTHGLLRLITVSRNRCSTAMSYPSHVVPKL